MFFNKHKEEFDRMCPRCDTPMIKKRQIRFYSNGKAIRYAICPNCGDVNFYVDNPETLVKS